MQGMSGRERKGKSKEEMGRRILSGKINEALNTGIRCHGKEKEVFFMFLHKIFAYMIFFYYFCSRKSLLINKTRYE